MHQKLLNLLLPILALGISTTGHAADQAVSVARHSDYAQQTACDVPKFIYDHALETAAGYLTGAGDDDGLDYVQRHTRDLFAPLLNGKFGPNCLTPELRHVAEALGHIDFGAGLPEANSPAVEPLFPAASRSAYMQSTGCLVSPSTWQKFQRVWHGVVFDSADDHATRHTLMTEFLQELSDSRPTESGQVAARCMTPAISVLATELGITSTTD